MKSKKRNFREQFDKSFQLKLVRLMYQRSTFTAVIRSVIKQEFFESKRLQWVVARLYWAHDNKDQATRAFLRREVKEHLEYGTIEEDDKKKYLLTISNLTKEISDANYIEEKVGEFAKHAKLRSGLYKAAIALEEDADVEKAEEELDKLSNALKQNDQKLDPLAFKKYMRRYNKKGPRKLRVGIPTGWESLDNAMGGHGGMPPRGRLGTIIAGTGAGKTLSLTQVGSTALRYFCHQKRFKTVLHVTGEDDTEAMNFRYQAHLLNTPFEYIKDKKYLSRVQKKYKRLNRALGKDWEEHLIIREFDPGDLSIAEIEGMILQLESEDRPVGLVIVDYLDLLVPKKIRNSDQGWQVLDNIYKESRGMLKRRKLSGWTGSQIDRQSQGAKRVRLNNVAGAIHKINSSDVGVAIEQTDREKAQGKGRASVVKVRFGKDKFRFELAIDYERQRMDDVGRIQEDEEE